MNGDRLLLLLAVSAASAFVMLCARQVLPPTRRLGGRVRPYTRAARTSLGRSADVRALAATLPDATILRRLLDPLLRRGLSVMSDRWSQANEAGLRVRIRQARILRHLPESQRLGELHLREAFGAATGMLAGIVGAALVGSPAVTVLAAGVLGGIFGGTRQRGALDAAIEDRRRRMHIELSTINHLIAMHVRIGGGIVQALQRVVERGNGEIVAELADVLRAHEHGAPIHEALTHAAHDTPEPAVARTYRLLAAGSEYGADLADALLAHAEDVREAHREALRREATKRRAAMLIPTIAVLAPVMLLFIAAPLPTLVFGSVR